MHQKFPESVKPAPAGPIYSAHCTEEFEQTIRAGEDDAKDGSPSSPVG
jgi:hypothetical protein